MKSESEENLLENARILQKIWLHRVFPIVFFSIMGKAKKLKVSKQNTVTTGEHQQAVTSKKRPINRLNIPLSSGSTWRPDCKRWDGSSNWEEQRSREDGRRWGEQSLWPPPHTNSEKLLWPCPHIGVTKIWWKVVLQFWELAPTPVGVSQETKPHSSLICPPA